VLTCLGSSRPRDFRRTDVCPDGRGRAVTALYAVLRLYLNFYQPSMKLLSKVSEGRTDDQELRQSAGAVFACSQTPPHGGGPCALLPFSSIRFREDFHFQAVVQCSLAPIHPRPVGTQATEDFRLLRREICEKP
jgi:hypothetical protein